MDDRIERLARLVVEFGANVQPGQLVEVFADLGKAELARAIAAVAYDRGAKFVEVTYYDPRVKHTRVSRVRDEWLEHNPPWWGPRVLWMGPDPAASISLAGAAAPHLLADHASGR